MQIQNDRTVSETLNPHYPARLPNEGPRYYAAIPSRLLANQNNIIDQVIQFAVDMLGARHVELRVYDAD